MNGWLNRSLRVVTAAAVLVAMGAVLESGTALAQKKKGKKDAGPPKTAKDLQKAYDNLREVGFLLDSSRVRLSTDLTHLHDQARALYKKAQAASEQSDSFRAGEMAAAAHDAARGVKHSLRARFKSAADVPAAPADAGLKPPPPPKGDRDFLIEKALKDLYKARAALSEQGTTRHSDFLTSARKAYDQARQAYQDGEYFPAGELAKAADAFAKVDGHLDRAGEGGTTREPLASPRETRPANAPPPPPPLPK